MCEILSEHAYVLSKLIVCLNRVFFLNRFFSVLKNNSHYKRIKNNRLAIDDSRFHDGNRFPKPCRSFPSWLSRPG